MKSCLYILFTVSCLMLSSYVAAAELTVRMFERGGKAPLQGVAVCLGTSASLFQFGAGFTDNDGYVVFARVPRTPLVVTVSRPGYMSEQEHMTGSDENRMLVLSLPTGGGGVECPLGRSEFPRGSVSLEIASFMLNNGASVTTDAQVTLDNKLSGHVTGYRASESPDFHGAEWQAYQEKPAFRLTSGSGNKTVYFQVRRYANTKGAAIESRSPVKHDSISAQYQ